MKFLKMMFVCVTCSALFSQEEALTQINREVPPPPVVSGLTATVTESTVILDWFPAPNIGGNNIIIRATHPITSNTLYNAQKRATIDHTQTSYTDTIEDGEAYYYAVLSQDTNGTMYEYLLPASNSLIMSVSSTNASPSYKPIEFSNFGTTIQNDSIIVSWNSAVQKNTLLLYRSTAPFANTNSLSQAVLVSSFHDTGIPFIDYPVPGVSYYYAILDESQLKSGEISFIEGKNTSIVPVEIRVSSFKFQRSILPSLRAMPLPSMLSSRNKNKTYFSKNTESKILFFTSQDKINIDIERKPYVFSSDINAQLGGEEYALHTIISTYFTSSDWSGALSSLRTFLSIRRSEQTTARSHFYLGQAYYFSNDYEKALVEFLLAQDIYENQAREWVRYTLEKLTVTAKK